MERTIPYIGGSELVRRLEALGLSPEAFSRETGLSHIAIRKHEAGKIGNPRRSTKLAIYETLERLEAEKFGIKRERFADQMLATKEMSWR